MNKMVNDLNYEGINISVSKKDYIKIEGEGSICIRVFSYENDLACPAKISEQPFEDQMGLLLITHENNYIKRFNKFMYNKTKNKNKKHFCRYSLQDFSSERVLIEHQKFYLKIFGRQSVKLFKNYFKQLAAPFKIYANFESILKNTKSDNKNSNASYTEKYQIIFLAVLLIYLNVLMTDLGNQLFFIEEKMQFINLLKQFLKNMIIVKK